uniref:Sideroflexin 4 n=1 Tax=Capra hircus TaxID=9925 RepID=A0A8C2R863_CAPHI
MEPNVRFWITERQEKIEKSRQLLLTNEDASRGDLEDKRIQEAWKRSLSTVHPDSSRLIPGPFRPAALLPFTAPTLFLSMLPVKNLKSMILPQASFYTYSTVFNIVNGNASYDRRAYESLLLGAGVIVSSTFLGLFPRLLQVRLSMSSILSRNVIPVFILAQLSGMNVIASRSLEPVRGIEVMDREGNVIGYSRKAGTKLQAISRLTVSPHDRCLVWNVLPSTQDKWREAGLALLTPKHTRLSHHSFLLGAVKDTATSRVVLFGTSAFIPEVFAYFFKRTQFFLQNPWSLWTLKLSCTILVMGLMVPVSFSVFPQIGRVSVPLQLPLKKKKKSLSSHYQSEITHSLKIRPSLQRNKTKYHDLRMIPPCR